MKIGAKTPMTKAKRATALTILIMRSFPGGIMRGELLSVLGWVLFGYHEGVGKDVDDSLAVGDLE